MSERPLDPSSTARGGSASGAERRQDALIQAGITLASELSLPTVLQKIVELACSVADAKYGALGVLGPGGSLEEFITTGISPEQRQAIGRLPVGMGVLGLLISDARPLRLTRIQDDPHSVGFPPDHPPMTSFLGVPVMVRGTLYGNLYLTEKRGGSEFTEMDETAVVTLAAQAGVAIENARLFEEAQQKLAWEERNRLARELHDSVSQALFSMTLQVRALQLALDKREEDRSLLAERVERLSELTQGALAEMKSLIFELRPEALREEGLVNAIQKHAEGLAAREELGVELDISAPPWPLPPDFEEQVFRIAQEALSNVVKHAAAEKVVVRLAVDDAAEELMLEVSDNGIGFDPTVRQPGHLGLGTMRERTERLGGRIYIDTEQKKGTTVRVVVSTTQSPPGSDDYDGQRNRH
ncbi:MAG TPA: GAF domain-containing sensor histidine kinase [Acidimicrobiia bacterium]